MVFQNLYSNIHSRIIIINICNNYSDVQICLQMMIAYYKGYLGCLGHLKANLDMPAAYEWREVVKLH